MSPGRAKYCLVSLYRLNRKTYNMSESDAAAAVVCKILCKTLDSKAEIKQERENECDEKTYLEKEMTTEENTPGPSKETKKPAKRGIIYLSTIPPYLNVSQIREIFSQYGTLGRVYLQLEDRETKPNEKKPKKHKAKKFTEGWIEFERKSVAKKVAALLNNTQVSTRKKSKHYDYIWNIKFLSNFKWTHLHERLAYEKAARRQKLRAEIQLAKKKTNYFTANLDKHKKNKVFVNKNLQNVEKVEEMVDEGIGSAENAEGRKEFLKSLFS